MSSVSSQPIIDLFLHQVGWIAPRLPDPSRPGVIVWLARQLAKESQDRLKPLFRLDHEVQLNAEKALILLLARTWQQPRPLRRALEIPERQVDWPHTYLTEISRPPERYWTREPILVPDLELRAALVTLAWNCIQLLELGTLGRAHQERRNRLQEAVAAVPLVARRSVVYQRHHEQRLLQGDPAARQAGQAIGAWRTFWLHRFGGDSDRAALQELAQRIDATYDTNADALLELVATMAIAQAACACSGPDRLFDAGWEIDGPIEHSRGRPVIRLRSGPFRCGLYKGLPHSPGGGKEGKAKDALTPLLLQLGDESTRGNQPDIVLSFWREGREDEWVAVLADAKRNAKKEDDGIGYLRKSVEL
ncbi:MAG TPA: hypothetical protein VH877_25630, partial [Polyangia bacterium]|nr:hypothetical protein [Polyangia bacterium]